MVPRRTHFLSAERPVQKEVTLSVYRISLPCSTEQSDQHYRRERD
nr:MAG TPA: hypothetical protein [Caudoviricetes sp.]